MSRNPRKIIVAETPEELEQQLRDLALPPLPAAELPGRVSTPSPTGPDDNKDPPPVQDEDPPSPIDSPPAEAVPDPEPAEPTSPQAEQQAGSAAPSPPNPHLRRYESRIHIVDAWKYPGSLTNKPDFIDPNWVSWVQFDEETKQEAGPALAVPTSGPYREKMCRKGDYVVRQLVTVDHSLPADPQLDVWTEAEFERIFIPSERPS